MNQLDAILRQLAHDLARHLRDTWPTPPPQYHVVDLELRLYRTLKRVEQEVMAREVNETILLEVE